MTRYYACAELAAMRLPGLPTTKKPWQKVVTRENWPSRPRKSKGGGLEYLPPTAVAALILAAPAGTSPAPDTLSSLPALVPVLPAGAILTVPAAFSSVAAPTDAQRLARDARTGVLAAVERLQLQTSCSRQAAMRTLLVSARAGEADESVDRLLRLARDHRGRGGDGYPSIRTVQRWLGSPDLTPIEPARDMEVPAWALTFLAAYQQPQKPAISQAYRAAFGCEPHEGHAGAPSIHQIRRFLGKVGAVSVESGRRLPRELKALRPFVRRTTAHMWPDDCYTADGHTFDAEIAHPKHGKPFRPEITTVLSVATRKVVGWSVNLAESTWAVLDALRHAVETHGVPALWYVDNGSGYRNALQADEVLGFAARLGIEITHSRPYNSQARGLEERSHQTLLVAAAKKLPTYIGAAMDREAKQKVHKITRADLRTSGRSRLLMEFPEFLTFLGAEFEAGNTRPSRALPKFVDAQGRRRHMSPADAHDAALAEGWSPTTLTETERHDLFRPYTTAKVLRGEIRLFGNLYFSGDLEEFHGEKVRVGYDIHDASRVWVRDHADGRLITVAGFEANHRAYFPQAVIDQAAQKRAQAREKRLEAHLTEVREELHGSAQALEHQTAADIPVEVFTAARLKLEAAEAAARDNVISLDVEARRPFFDTDPEKYRWLIAHADRWDAHDAAWLLDYAAGEYAILRERFEAYGEAWTEELRGLAESLRPQKQEAAR